MSVRLLVRDASDLVIARREIRALGRAQGLADAAIESMAVAVTEVARNMLVHGGGGELLLEAASAAVPPFRSGVVAIAIDHGPGISDVDLAMTDGYSTAGSLGLGLPSARRLVDELEIRATVGGGTSILLRKWASADDGGASAGKQRSDP